MCGQFVGTVALFKERRGSTEARVPKTMSEEDIPRSEYCLDLTHRLQEALKHDLYFAHALYEQSTEAETDILESLIGLSNGRRSNGMSFDERERFVQLKRVDRSHGGTVHVSRARRLYKVL